MSTAPEGEQAASVSARRAVRKVVSCRRCAKIQKAILWALLLMLGIVSGDVGYGSRVSEAD